MGRETIPLDEIIKELPPEEQSEVRDFAEFLVERWKRRQGRPLRQDWAGALRDYREQYTSLELQEQAMKWRTE